MTRLWDGIKRAARCFRDCLDPASKLAQIIAVGIAGFWTYHIYQITGEGDINPEVWVSAQTLPYSNDARFLVVHIREKNVGKVPIELKPDALCVIVKRAPEGLSPGSVDMDKQKSVFEQKTLLKGYEDGVELSAGTEFEDVTEFVVPPGLYHIEATIELPEDEIVSDIAVQRVE